MIDTHYDLLTIAYSAYIKNDYSYLEKVSRYFNQDNVVGVIANLYFMGEEEMRKEISPYYYSREVSVLEMFVKAKEVLDSYLPDTDILYSIEGADFIQGEEELEKLHEAGLDALVIAWNTKSKYASGNRSDQGLTDDGKKLLKKAISLGMGIDLSHANGETFNDMIELIKEEKQLGSDVCCYASHSNSRALSPLKRNLDDYQLQMIRDVDGQVGVFSNRNFVVPLEVKNLVSAFEKKQAYLKHIDYIAAIIGKDNIVLATDDMDFCKGADSEYGELAIYDYEKLASEVADTLSQKYDKIDVYNMMYGTAKKKIFNKIRNYKKDRGVK